MSIIHQDDLINSIADALQNISYCHPKDYIARFAEAGADGITVHVEAEQPVDELIADIRALNRRVGISLVPSTEPERAFPYLDKVDLILPMTVFPAVSSMMV